MTTLTRPTPRPRAGTDTYDPANEPLFGSARQDRFSSDNGLGGGDLTAELRLDVRATGLDSDSVTSYGLDGFTPASVEKCGASDPQDSIDLEGLAEQIYLLLRREAYIERERHGAQR
jgi:hypothetical protein